MSTRRNGLDKLKRKKKLFDTEVDPHELNNLAAVPGYADKLTELRAEMDTWMEEIGDRGLVSEEEYIASIWPDGVQPETEPPVIEREGRLVRIFCGTKGASIGYQIVEENGEKQGAQWNLYTGPFELVEGMRVVAVAHRIGFAESETIEFK